MGKFINEHETFEQVLSEYRIYVPYTKNYENFLKGLGYVKCSGSAAYEEDIKSWCVQPFSKKYWRDRPLPTISVEQETIKYFKLKEA